MSSSSNLQFLIWKGKKKGGTEEEQRDGNKVEWRETTEERRDVQKKTKREEREHRDSLVSKVHCCCLDTRSHVAQLCQKLAETKDYGDMELLIFLFSALELWIFRCVQHDVSF